MANKKKKKGYNPTERQGKVSGLVNKILFHYRDLKSPRKKIENDLDNDLEKLEFRDMNERKTMIAALFIRATTNFLIQEKYLSWIYDQLKKKKNPSDIANMLKNDNNTKLVFTNIDESDLEMGISEIAISYGARIKTAGKELEKEFREDILKKPELITKKKDLKKMKRLLEDKYLHGADPYVVDPLIEEIENRILGPDAPEYKRKVLKDILKPFRERLEREGKEKIERIKEKKAFLKHQKLSSEDIKPIDWQKTADYLRDTFSKRTLDETSRRSGRWFGDTARRGGHGALRLGSALRPVGGVPARKEIGKTWTGKQWGETKKSFGQARQDFIKHSTHGISDSIRNRTFLKGWKETGESNPIRKVIWLIIFCVFGAVLMSFLGSYYFFFAFLFWAFYMMTPADVDIFTREMNKIKNKYMEDIKDTKGDPEQTTIYLELMKEDMANKREEIDKKLIEYAGGRTGRLITKTMFQLAAFFCIVTGLLTSGIPLAKPVGLVVGFLLYMGMGGVRDVKD